MADVHANGVRLYYEEHGEGDAIVCIHGTSSSALVWGDAVGELARLGRVIAYDRRGCTRSERPEPYERTTVAEHAEDASGLIDELEAAPAIVIGRSYGGEVALELALRHPEQVRALALLEPAALGFSAEADEWGEGIRDRMHAVAERDGVDAVAEAFLREVAGDAWDSFPDAARRMFTDNGPAILAEIEGGDLEADAETLARIEQPTLLVAASGSPPVFREVAEAIARAIPKARTATVAGSHLINPADPAVVAFVEEVLAAG